MTEFSKIKLRTKIGSPVISSEMDVREILLSNYESVVFVKDVNGNMLRFIPVNDNTINLATCWSSTRIAQEFTTFLSTYFDVIDGGTL